MSIAAAQRSCYDPAAIAALKEQTMTVEPGQFADQDFCYLTTRGRVSGRPHTIEIWFALNEHSIYMLAGGRERSDWVKNLLRDPAVTVRLRDVTFAGQARVVERPDEDALARRMVLEKYQPGYGEDLTDWGRDSLPVAVDLAPEV
jgi:deazaflavin-dependent oxidoreductase (nitroreductase family)